MIKEKNTISIVIPIFNRFAEIIRLLDQLNAQSYQNFKVIIIDHGTEDFILDKSLYSFQIEIIKASSDLWFTGAVNRGLEHILNTPQTTIKYVLIMNDDIIIEDIDFLRKLLNEGNDRKIVSCMAITKDNEIIYAGIKLEKYKLKYKCIGKGTNIDTLNSAKISCDVLPTRCTLVPVNVIHQIGFLNEHRLPHYASDYEWTNRAKKKGFDLITLTNIYIKTELNTNEVSGRKKYESQGDFIKDFFNKYKRTHLFQIVNYSFLVFHFPYNILFSSHLIIRKLTGFFLTNFFGRSWKGN